MYCEKCTVVDLIGSAAPHWTEAEHEAERVAVKPTPSGMSKILKHQMRRAGVNMETFECFQLNRVDEHFSTS